MLNAKRCLMNNLSLSSDLMKGQEMTNETKKLLEDADEYLDKAYKSIRIAISDLRKDKDMQIRIQPILTEIDKAKQDLEQLLYPASDIEIYRFTTEDKSVVFTEANHI